MTQNSRRIPKRNASRTSTILKDCHGKDSKSGGDSALAQD